MVRDESKREQASGHGGALVPPRLCILAYSSLLSAILAAGFLLRKRSACRLRRVRSGGKTAGIIGCCYLLGT